MLIRIAALVPPILQHFALRQLLLEDLIGLLKRVSKIGDADVEDSIRRAAREVSCFHSADRASGWLRVFKRSFENSASKASS